jgi:hypothetical protein
MHKTLKVSTIDAERFSGRDRTKAVKFRMKASTRKATVAVYCVPIGFR